MGEVLGVLAVVGLLAAIMGALAWLGMRVRRRGRVGAGDAFLGPFEEIWHPAAHRARLDSHVVSEHVAPMPSPDDQLR